MVDFMKMLFEHRVEPHTQTHKKKKSMETFNNMKSALSTGSFIFHFVFYFFDFILFIVF